MECAQVSLCCAWAQCCALSKPSFFAVPPQPSPRCQKLGRGGGRGEKQGSELEWRVALRSRFPPSSLAHPANLQSLLFQAMFPCLLLQTRGIGMVGTMRAAGRGVEVCTFPSPGVRLVLVALWVTPGPVPSQQQGPPERKVGRREKEREMEGLMQW